MIDKLPEKNKFIIMISTLAANALRFSIDFKSNDLAALFNIIWNNIDQQKKKTAELAVIKIRDSS